MSRETRETALLRVVRRSYMGYKHGMPSQYHPSQFILTRRQQTKGFKFCILFTSANYTLKTTHSEHHKRD